MGEHQQKATKGSGFILTLKRIVGSTVLSRNAASKNIKSFLRILVGISLLKFPV